MSKYKPRRAGKRWLLDAPEYILDCFYHKDSDSYDILFTGSLLGTIIGEPQDFAHVYVMGLDVDSTGAWASFELSAYEAANNRYRNSHKRIKWNDLPESVRASVKRWAETDFSNPSE